MPAEKPVLILAPQGRDADVAGGILREVGEASRACQGLDDLIAGLAEACCAVISEEGLLSSGRKPLADWIQSQPPWSDFPFILLTFRGSAPDPRLMELLGNVTILERPFHPKVLVTAVRAASRARLRQKEAEHYLEERQRSEEHKEFLIRELHHRVKNMLATVQALIRAPRSAQTLEQFRDDLLARLRSLAQTHDLLLNGDWRAVSLRALVASELAPFEDGDAGRIVLDGPAVELSPESAFAIGMIVHELATNAAKYGSLSAENGGIEVEWQTRADGRGAELFLSWKERGGPPVSEPSRRGFGTRLIERMLSGRHAASYSFDFQPSGVNFALTLPLDPHGWDSREPRDAIPTTPSVAAPAD